MCDSLVARGVRTTDGATLFAKNSDRRGRECQPFVQWPAAFHTPRSRLRCTHIEIDQVAETYRVMGHSPAWCWGFEQGVNEFGVAIGNHATWSREPLEQQPGLIGMDLVRLGLERGRDAREALEVIATLVETHGQGGSAFAAEGDGGYQNSFAVADGVSSWVLETTARGWAAREVDGAGLSNALTLGTDWQIGSRELERHAHEEGFWARGTRLDFKQAYSRVDASDFLTRRRLESASDRLAAGSLSVDALKRWLRDHGSDDTPRGESLESRDPDRYSVCMHADPVSTTTASLVVRLPERVADQPWPVWISFATPCTGIFIPVYLQGVLPAALAASGTAPGGDSGSEPGPIGVGDRVEGDSMWEVMRALQERAARDFEHTLPILRRAWAEHEEAIELERTTVEAEVRLLMGEEEREESARRLSEFMQSTADRVLEVSHALARAI
jgi:secernin